MSVGAVVVLYMHVCMYGWVGVCVCVGVCVTCCVESVHVYIHSPITPSHHHTLTPPHPQVLREYGRSKRITTLPNPLEFFAYLFACGNLLAGPFYEYADYSHYIHKTGPYTQPWPRPWVPGLLRFVKGVFYMVLFIRFSAEYSPFLLETSRFFDLSTVYRYVGLLLVVVVVVVVVVDGGAHVHVFVCVCVYTMGTCTHVVCITCGLNKYALCDLQVLLHMQYMTIHHQQPHTYIHTHTINTYTPSHTGRR